MKISWLYSKLTVTATRSTASHFIQLHTHVFRNSFVPRQISERTSSQCRRNTNYPNRIWRSGDRASR